MNKKFTAMMTFIIKKVSYHLSFITKLDLVVIYVEK